MAISNSAVSAGEDAAAGAEASAPKLTGKTPLGREIAYTLRHAAEYLARGAKAEPDPILLLRAGRACWLLGDLEPMCAYYREAQEQLVEIADSAGRRTGTSSEYWRLTLGAAWMVAINAPEGKQRQADQIAFRALARRAQESGSRLALEAAQPLDRMALEMLRLRGAWYGNDLEYSRVLASVDQRSMAMDSNSKALWSGLGSGERDQLMLAALKSFARERAERWALPLMAIDEFLEQFMARPPTVMDLVDEELMALASIATKAGARQVSLRFAPKVGARRSEVART